MEIVPVENHKAYADEIVAVDDVKVQYFQTADCNSHPDAFQHLAISTENNGTARFIVLKTSRWAISEIDDIVKVLKDFQVRAGLFDKGENKE